MQPEQPMGRLRGLRRMWRNRRHQRKHYGLSPWVPVQLPVVNVVDFGADPTGEKDSTAAIQAAYDYASMTNGAHVIYGKPGDTFKVERPINYPKSAE